MIEERKYFAVYKVDLPGLVGRKFILVSLVREDVNRVRVAELVDREYVVLDSNFVCRDIKTGRIRTFAEGANIKLV